MGLGDGETVQAVRRAGKAIARLCCTGLTRDGAGAACRKSAVASAAPQMTLDVDVEAVLKSFAEYTGCGCGEHSTGHRTDHTRVSSQREWFPCSFFTFLLQGSSHSWTAASL